MIIKIAIVEFCQSRLQRQGSRFVALPPMQTQHIARRRARSRLNSEPGKEHDVNFRYKSRPICVILEPSLV